MHLLKSTPLGSKLFNISNLHETFHLIFSTLSKTKDECVYKLFVQLLDSFLQESWTRQPLSDFLKEMNITKVESFINCHSIPNQALFLSCLLKYDLLSDASDLLTTCERIENNIYTRLESISSEECTLLLCQIEKVIFA